MLMAVLGAVGNTHVHLDPRLLTYISGLVIPLVVGLVTKLHASSGLKATLNLVLSAIAGAVATALASNGDVVLSTWVAGFAQTFVISIASYYGLWKPTGIAQSVQASTANVGVGPSAPPRAIGPGGRDDILPGDEPQDVGEPPDSTVGVAQDVAPAPAVRTAQKRAASSKGAKKR